MRYAADFKLKQARWAGENIWDGKVDREILLELADHLGITKPIKVRRSSGTHLKGRHRYRRHPRTFEGKHDISLSAYMTVKETNEVLRHEMMHAAQVERYINEHGEFEGCRKYMEAYRSQQRQRGGNGGYKGNRFEEEAREFEKNGTINPVTQEPCMTPAERTALARAQHDRELAGVESHLGPVQTTDVVIKGMDGLEFHAKMHYQMHIKPMRAVCQPPV